MLIVARSLKKYRTSEAAAFLGVHHQTVREWERAGLIKCVRVGPARQRQFDQRELERFQAEREGRSLKRKAVLYARVSGSTGKETSLHSQVKELEARAETDEAEIVQVFREKASGLNENRPKLKKALTLIRNGSANTLYVTHSDRLTRFGFDYLAELVEAYGGEVIVLHDQEETSPEQELLQDFTSLIACFSGRLYGQNSAAARKRLIKEASDGA